MKILLFGANGQVGSACQQTLAQENWHLIALTRSDADFNQPEQVSQAIYQHEPDIVVNACAYTAVDKAEAEPKLAELINADSVEAMGLACTELSIPCIHLSTDYVFDGNASTPYREDDAVAPTGRYGQSKLLGEQKLAQATPHHVILRTSWVFGDEGNNFVKTMLRLGAERDELNVVDDQRGRPTYAGDIASVIAKLIQRFEKNGKLPWGLFHCSNEGECSWFEFAQAIFKAAEESGVLARAPKVNAITSAQYPTAAPRPAYSVLATDKLEKLLRSPMRHWEEGLQQLFGNMVQHTIH